MATYLVLIRGINVGGVVLKMNDLRDILTRLGLENVTTYIQSGNALFESDRGDVEKMAGIIRASILKEKDLDVAVIVKEKDEMEQIVSSHPFATHGNEENLYVTVLAGQPTEKGVETVTNLNSDTDKFVIKAGVVYSYYGNGYGKSKYTNNYLEKKLGVSGTTRNWKTMTRLLQLMNGEK